jgi:hypothetical protein
MAGDNAWTADLWQAVSQDGGQSWQEFHVDGPFDLRPAEGAFTDYTGLVPVPDGFLAAYDIGTDDAGVADSTEGNTDVMLVRLRKP